MSELHRAHRSHPRELREFSFVYAVLSRRAGGISVGVNLSPHKRCNFDCTYCQVDRTTPGRLQRVDVDRLRDELRAVFEAGASGELAREPMFSGAPDELRHIADVALSGDGEPTAEPWFPEAARVVAEERTRAELEIPYRIITNATTFHVERVRRTLRHLDDHGLDVWAKLDAGTSEYYALVDRSRVRFERVLDNLRECALARPTTIQALFARHHGDAPSRAEIDAWARRLGDIRRAGGELPWVQVHTIARPPAESFVTPLSLPELEEIAVAARLELPDARVVAYRGAL